ncbi:MAG: hypothetical protein HDT16_04665 [Oscillibacter sp.]|nr:hypothetical protein [Oscillibacter sp.]
MNSYSIYIIAISLQLSGALLLLWKAVSTKRNNLIKSFAKSKVITYDSNTGEIIYNKDAFIETCENAFLNKAAFLYISIGYFLGIWGEIGPDNNKIITAVIIFSISALEIVLTCLVVSIICEHCTKITTPITYDELITLNLDVNQSTISFDEIDELTK